MTLLNPYLSLLQTKKINVNSADSSRNLIAAIGEAITGRSYDFLSNPSGSFRAVNVDPLIKILSGSQPITQPLYGSNLKVELNGANGAAKNGGVFAINAYSLISGSGVFVDKNVGISVLADVGNGLTGTVVNNNFSLEVNGVASRSGTVVTNSRSVVVNCPNFGNTRRGLLIGAEQTTGLAVGANNISFENLGTSRLVGLVTCEGSLNVLGNGFFTDLQTSLSTPASSSAAGSAGSIKADADYVYVCTATNTWKRAALSAW